MDDEEYEGRCAYYTGLSKSDNPYNAVGEEAKWEAWLTGYNDAQWDD